MAFARGAKSTDQSPERIRSFNAEWHFSGHLSVLNRVMQVPLWLGDDGQGTLLFIRPLENLTLGSLAAPGIDLFLHAGDQIIASSLGSQGRANLFFK